MKTSELDRLDLDFWVAKAEGKQPVRFGREGDAWIRCVGDLVPYSPSMSTKLAGDIALRDRIAVIPLGEEWGAYLPDGRAAKAGAYAPAAEHIGVRLDDADGIGPTPMVAVARARVFAVYGLEVPDVAE